MSYNFGESPYEKFWDQYDMEGAREFMDLMNKYMEAWTSFHHISQEGQENPGNINEETLLSARMEHDLAAKKLHDYLVSLGLKKSGSTSN